MNDSRIIQCCCNTQLTLIILKIALLHNIRHKHGCVAYLRYLIVILLHLFESHKRLIFIHHHFSDLLYSDHKLVILKLEASQLLPEIFSFLDPVLLFIKESIELRFPEMVVRLDGIEGRATLFHLVFVALSMLISSRPLCKRSHAFLIDTQIGHLKP